MKMFNSISSLQNFIFKRLALSFLFVERSRFSLILVLLVSFHFLMTDTVSAQTLETKVTYELNNQSLDEGLKLLKQLSGFNISYTQQAVSPYKKIVIEKERRAVKEVLELLLTDTDLQYTVKNGQIVVSPQRKLVESIRDRAGSENDKSSYTLKFTVSDGKNKELITGAVCRISSLGAVAITDSKGWAQLIKIPKGYYNVDVSCLGYETRTVRVDVKSNLNLAIKMDETSLQLQEVTVVGKSSAAGEATATRIGRQAIDHLQATNLADLMQLIPGQLVRNADMTSMQQVQLRSASSFTDKNNSFGTQIIVDGVPMSNNASADQKMGNSTAGTGVDVRSIGADNIESVEVIRGIPSAEYGDLTSGAVIVNMKAGKTPYEFRTKVNPTTINTSLGKGWSLGKEAGILNASFDYAQSWGDPREKTHSFDRMSGSLIHSATIFHKVRTKTKLAFNSLIDWNGNDPDQENDGTRIRQTAYGFQLNHEGRILLNLPLSRTLSYVLSYGDQYNKTENSSYVTSSGIIPILTSRETGYFDVPFYGSSYLGSGGSISKPRTFYAKINNVFAKKLVSMEHQFNMGVEYRNESNKAKGYYNEDESRPLTPSSDGRPRPYYDVPSLNQLSAFFEDKVSWKLWGMDHKLQAGVRYTHLQPGKLEQVKSLSPRLNLAVNVTKTFTLRGGFGMNSKTPGLVHLYPEKKYMDRMAANYTGVSNEAERLLLYHTYVYDVKRTIGLKNSTNTKFEIGFDWLLPQDRRFTVSAYWDKTPNGFGNVTDFLTYNANYYTLKHGLTPQVGSKPLVNYNDPDRVDTVFISKGNYGNTAWAYNRGVEFDFDLGRIKAWNTSFYLNGAYMETESCTKGLTYSSPSDMDNTIYVGSNTAPLKYVYQSDRVADISRRFSTQLRAVVNIPRMRMVLSTSCQVIWYSYAATKNQAQDPIGYITTNPHGGIDYNEITASMLADETYKIRGCLLSKARLKGKDNPPVTQPSLMLLSTRLTKDISDVAGFSFYVNNTLFYQPWQRSSVSSTLTERNEGTFNFGMELFFKF